MEPSSGERAKMIGAAMQWIAHVTEAAMPMPSQDTGCFQRWLRGRMKVFEEEKVVIRVELLLAAVVRPEQ
jgi:hypothetical protein